MTPGLDLRRAGLLVALLALALYFWDSPLLWPFKLLVVMIHETGHALASLAVGGSVREVVLAANESGHCLSLMPEGFIERVVSYSAGYVGSAAAGAGLLVLTYRFRVRRLVLGAAAVWLTVMGVIYAGNAFTLGFCLVSAAVFALGARLLPVSAVELVNAFLGPFCALYVLQDLRTDLWDGTARVTSDAGLLAAITPIPAVIWVILWTVASLALLGLAVLWSVRRTTEASKARFDKLSAG